VSDIDIESNRRTPAQYDSVNVLIVEDEPETARLMLATLARKGVRAQLAGNAKAALAALDKNRCDLVFLSTSLGYAPNRLDGFELLATIRAAAPEMPIVMLAGPQEPSGAGNRPADGHHLLRLGTQTAVRAIQAGCRDFLLKPLSQQTIEGVLETMLPNRRVATAASACEGDRCLYQIVGRSARLVQTITLAERIAPTSVPVLINGESGTGKELISMLIHHNSKRALGPFVHVNCAALSDTLLESELFGHEKGAFTGAYTQRKGLSFRPSCCASSSSRNSSGSVAARTSRSTSASSARPIATCWARCRWGVSARTSTIGSAPHGLWSRPCGSDART
jgi:two-component system response regulator AtoC